MGTVTVNVKGMTWGHSAVGVVPGNPARATIDRLTGATATEGHPADVTGR